LTLATASYEMNILVTQTALKKILKVTNTIQL